MLNESGGAFKTYAESTATSANKRSTRDAAVISILLQRLGRIGAEKSARGGQIGALVSLN